MFYLWLLGAGEIRHKYGASLPCSRLKFSLWHHRLFPKLLPAAIPEHRVSSKPYPTGCGHKTKTKKVKPLFSSQALTAADLNLVLYVCETVDPGQVFGQPPCPLSQPVLLSLIQQLASDLGTKTDLKLR